MIFDIPYKILRKSINQKLYTRLSLSFFGRKKRYENIRTYQNIFNHYKDQGIEFKEKKVVEVGSGTQFFTAFFFLLDKAEKVILVEPKLEFQESNLLSQLTLFNSISERKLDFETLKKQIECFKSLEEVTANYEGKIDLIFSFTVLEHIENLNQFLKNSYQVLKTDGISYHLIDLTDHTYQVFLKFKITSWIFYRRSLYHLRYSKKVFDFLNDPKCFMNRMLKSDYIESVTKNNFKILDIKISEYGGKIAVHSDLIDPQSQNTSALKTTTINLRIAK